MITYLIATAVLSSYTGETATSLAAVQSRPGTFDRSKRMTEEALDANRRIGLDYQAARMLLEEGRPHDALVRLLPWRERIVTHEVSEESIDNAKATASRLIYMCYVALEDWQGAVSMAEDRNEYVYSEKGLVPHQIDSLHLSTAYYLSGQEQQAWELFQISLREFGTKGYEYYFEDTKDEPLDRENFGYSLMLAAARETWSSSLTQQVFLRKAIEERPQDVLVIRKLARSLSLAGDLAAAIPYYELLYDLGTAEEAKDAVREVKLLEWRIAFRARVASGG